MKKKYRTLIAGFAKGSHTKCYVNPRNYKIAVLYPELDWAPFRHYFYWALFFWIVSYFA